MLWIITREELGLLNKPVDWPWNFLLRFFHLQFVFKKILLVLKWFLFTSKLSFFFFFFPHLIGTVCHSRNSGSEELVSINCWVRVLECIFNWSWFVSFTPSSVCMRIFYLFSLLRLLCRIFNNSKKTVDCLLLMINSEYSKTFLRDLQNKVIKLLGLSLLVIWRKVCFFSVR